MRVFKRRIVRDFDCIFAKQNSTQLRLTSIKREGCAATFGQKMRPYHIKPHRNYMRINDFGMKFQCRSSHTRAHIPRASSAINLEFRCRYIYFVQNWHLHDYLPSVRLKCRDWFECSDVNLLIDSKRTTVSKVIPLLWTKTALNAPHHHKYDFDV